MSLKKFTITGITGGRSKSRFSPRNAEFTSSAGIDPDLTVGSEKQASGQAIPSAYTKFSGSEVNTSVIAVITTPKTTKIYVVTAGGKLISYDSSFGSETLLGTVTGSNAGGAAYYNNFIYIMGTGASKNDVSRWGPLDGVAAMTNAWWSGLGLTALTNTTYPIIRLVSLPNHWGHSHLDDALYFCDFTNGQGIINKIKTVTGGGIQGNTNSGSAYNVLDLPFGYYPTSIGSYGTNVAITAVQTTADTLNQGPAALFIWNPTNDITFDQQIAFPDSMATALITRNGRLIAFSGSVQRGCRVAEYVGGSTFQEMAYIEDGTPPLAGAVDTQGDRVYFGSYCLEPLESAAMWAMGSRTATKPNDVQNVAVVGVQTPNASQVVTALKNVAQQSAVESNAQFVIAMASDSTKEVYRKTTGGSSTIGSMLELPVISVGSTFRIDRIRVPLASAVTSGTAITPYVIYDDGVSQESLEAISNSTIPGATRRTYKTPEMTGSGQNNFRLKFDWTNATVATGLQFPIEGVLEVFDDEPLSG